MIIKVAFGIVVAFALGFVCRWFDIPAPAPPKLFGALLVVSITGGFLLAGYLTGL